MLMLANGNGDSSARSRFIGLMPGGRSLYCGWNPPTLSAIVPLSPPVSTKQASPSMVIGPTCELTSEPKMLTPWASKKPTTVACNTAKGTSSQGSDTAKRPKIATPDVPAITATVADTMVGVPQPTLSIGPAKKSPGRTGKQRSRAGRTDGASATGSRGKNIEPMAPLNVASCRRVLVHAPVDADHAADPDEREAERQLDRRTERRRQDGDHRHRVAGRDRREAGDDDEPEVDADRPAIGVRLTAVLEVAAAGHRPVQRDGDDLGRPRCRRIDEQVPAEQVAAAREAEADGDVDAEPLRLGADAGELEAGGQVQAAPTPARCHPAGP